MRWQLSKSWHNLLLDYTPSLRPPHTHTYLINVGLLPQNVLGVLYYGLELGQFIPDLYIIHTQREKIITLVKPSLYSLPAESSVVACHSPPR